MSRPKTISLVLYLVCLNASTATAALSLGSSHYEINKTTTNRFLDQDLQQFLGKYLLTKPSDNHRHGGRHLQSDSVSFEYVCMELRAIFRNKCSCGEFWSEASNRIDCQDDDNENGGIRAIAQFTGLRQDDETILSGGSSSFGMPDPSIAMRLESFQVCQNIRDESRTTCTTLQYGLSSDMGCKVTYGGPNKACQSCTVCQVDESLVGLEIDCHNLHGAHTTQKCTAATDLLGLSGSMSLLSQGRLIVGLTIISAVALVLM